MLAEKAIHTKSVKNVEDARLLARLDFLRANLKLLHDSREEFRARVREIVNIERELAFRRIPFKPVSDARHLAVSVDDVRVTRPYTRADTHYAETRR